MPWLCPTEKFAFHRALKDIGVIRKLAVTAAQNPPTTVHHHYHGPSPPNNTAVAAPAPSLPPAEEGCQKVFVSYEPSAWEADWVKNAGARMWDPRNPHWTNACTVWTPPASSQGSLACRLGDLKIAARGGGGCTF